MLTLLRFKLRPVFAEMYVLNCSVNGSSLRKGAFLITLEARRRIFS